MTLKNYKNILKDPLNENQEIEFVKNVSDKHKKRRLITDLFMVNCQKFSANITYS